MRHGLETYVESAASDMDIRSVHIRRATPFSVSRSNVLLHSPNELPQHTEC